MSKTFEDAVAEAARLPEAVQEKIGQERRAYVEKLRRLRSDVELGVRSLDAGAGKSVDIEDIIRRARARHDKA